MAGSHWSLQPHMTGSILVIQPVSDATGADGKIPVHATLEEDESGSC